jgi:hypothetical protein
VNESQPAIASSEDHGAIGALLARTAVVIPSYWSRSHGFRRPGDSIEDHPTPANEQGTMGRLLASLQALAEKPRLVLVIISSTAPDVATSAAWQVDTIRDRYPDLPIALWTPAHVQILHGRLRSLGHEDWIGWFDARGYPQIRNMQLLVPLLLGMDLVVALDDDEVVEDPSFLRRAAEIMLPQAGSRQSVQGAAGYYLDQSGNRLHDVGPAEASSQNPFERKMTLMNGMLERIETLAGDLVPSSFALGGNMTFSRDLIRAAGFDPAIARGEDIDYVLNAALVGQQYWFDKRRPIRHLPPPGRSYRDFDYGKLRQDVRRFLYEREKLRAAAADGFVPIQPSDLDPYPGAFLHDDLEAHAVESLRLHQPAVRNAGLASPEAFVQEAATSARAAAAGYPRFARAWPEAMALLGDDPVLRHVARSILPG